jgi:opacity protein-like surface antigen
MRYLMMIAALCFGTSVQAESHSYGNGSGGNLRFEVFAGVSKAGDLFWSNRDYATETATIAGIAITKRYSDKLSFGVELSNVQHRFTGTRNFNRADTLLATAKYDLFQGDKAAFYAGGGFGLINARYHQIDGQSFGELIPGLQVSLGTRFDLSEKMDLFVEARHLRGLKKFTIEGAGTIPLPAGRVSEFQSTNLVIGLGFKF